MQSISRQRAPFAQRLSPLSEARPARCILLTGAGKHFSAGRDVRFFPSTLDLPLAERQGVFDEILHILNDVMPRLRQVPNPVVGSARGAVAGLGVSLTACDIAIAAREAVFSMAYCAIGGVPAGASAAIAKLSNHKLAAGPIWALGRAKQLLTSAETTPLEMQLARA
jgi:enoyl-CoA hydratase/carnithine racemase